MEAAIQIFGQIGQVFTVGAGEAKGTPGKGGLGGGRIAQVFNQTGQLVATIAATPNGQGVMEVANRRGGVVAQLGVNSADHIGTLQLENAGGKIKVQAGTNNVGHGYVAALTNGIMRVEAKPFNPSTRLGP